MVRNRCYRCVVHCVGVYDGLFLSVGMEGVTFVYVERHFVMCENRQLISDLDLVEVLNNLILNLFLCKVAYAVICKKPNF